MNKNIQVSLEISFILNATEDEEKSVRWISEFIGTNKLSRVDVKGYYGNLMHIITMSITKNRAEVILGKILNMISEEDMENILTSLEKSIDKNGSLHLRIDKQSILEGSLRLSDRDPLKMKIIPRLATPISLNWPKWYRLRLAYLRKQYRD